MTPRGFEIPRFARDDTSMRYAHHLLQFALITLATACCWTSLRAADIPDYTSSDGQKWKLLWHDEFNGGEKLDETKWTFGLPWGGTDGAFRQHNNQYASYMMEHNVAVGDGSLKLLT